MAKGKSNVLDQSQSDNQSSDSGDHYQYEKKAMLTDVKVSKYRKFEKNWTDLKAQGYEDAIRDRALDLISKQ